MTKDHIETIGVLFVAAWIATLMGCFLQGAPRSVILIVVALVNFIAFVAVVFYAWLDNDDD